MTISVTLPGELEQFLQTQAGRLGMPLETLLSQTIEERWGAASHAKSLSARETELLLAIQNAFPQEQSEQYRVFCQHSDDGTITEAEREQFLVLIDQRDLQNAERLRSLGELARLRGITMRELMSDLEIRPE